MRGVYVTVLILGVASCTTDNRPEQGDDASGSATLPSWGTTGDGTETDTGVVDTGLATTTTTDGGLTGTSTEDDNTCAEIEVSLDTIIPTVWLLVDRSGSMDWNIVPDDDTSPQRWGAVRDALLDENDGVVTALQDRVRFGLTFYTADDQCPNLDKEEPALDNRDALAALYVGTGPGGNTPTGPSIEATADDLAGFDAEGPKVIVLATDGEPNSCDSSGANGQPASISATQYAYGLGIRTYVLSVGSNVGEAHLQDLANVGAGNPADASPGEPFYLANNPEELAQAFNDIIGDVISCELTLEGEIDPEDACEGTVTLDGTELVCGTDWELSDETTLVLLGDACDTLRDGSQHDVAATFPCGTVYIP